MSCSKGQGSLTSFLTRPSQVLGTPGDSSASSRPLALSRILHMPCAILLSHISGLGNGVRSCVHTTPQCSLPTIPLLPHAAGRSHFSVLRCLFLPWGKGATLSLRPVSVFLETSFCPLGSIEKVTPSWGCLVYPAVFYVCLSSFQGQLLCSVSSHSTGLGGLGYTRVPDPRLSISPLPYCCLRFPSEGA